VLVLKQLPPINRLKVILFSVQTVTFALETKKWQRFGEKTLCRASSSPYFRTTKEGYFRPFTPRNLSIMNLLKAIRFTAFSLLLTVGSAVVAQQATSKTLSQKADFSTDMLLVLPETDHMPYAYDIDITGIDFKNAETAQQYFRGVSNNLVHFEANEEGTKVTMRLQYQNLGQKEWTRNDWNAYLATLQARYQDYLTRMND